MFVCRPTNGFVVGSSCFYSRDCDVSKSEFCKDAGHPDGRCSVVSQDMEPCEKNNECSSGTCALQHGLSCVLSDGNCVCRPPQGFSSGTHATSALAPLSRSSLMQLSAPRPARGMQRARARVSVRPHAVPLLQQRKPRGVRWAVCCAHELPNVAA